MHFCFSPFIVSANFKSTVYYKDSVNLLRKYRPAIECLGEPILAGNIDFGSRGAVVADGFRAKVSIKQRFYIVGLISITGIPPSPCVLWGLGGIILEITG